MESDPFLKAKAVRLHPSAYPLQGDVEISGSKSLTNRALILAALSDPTVLASTDTTPFENANPDVADRSVADSSVADSSVADSSVADRSVADRSVADRSVADSGRVSVVHGVLHCDDSHWCIGALESLGIQIGVNGTTVTVGGCGGRWANQEAAVFTGSSGTLSRFLPPALAAGTGTYTLRASEQMSKRPVGPLVDALRALGTDIQYLGSDGYYPFVLNARGFHGSEVQVPGNVSSQYLSGLLMAAPLAQSPLTIRIENDLVQPAYIDLTLSLMREFGVEVDRVADERGIGFRVSPQRYRPETVTLEADASTAGYFFALAALTRGRIRVVNLDARTTQPDIALLDVLERMGARVVRGAGWTEVHGPQQLRGGFSVSLHEFSDQALTVGALAVFADGPVTVTDVGHIRKHESDRIAALHACLERLGVQMTEMEDGFTVTPGLVSPARLATFDDHRVAMSMALIGAVIPGIELEDPGCVSKTCPDFFSRIQNIGVGVEVVERRPSS
ncbi:hypothetical protein AN477_01000 [Alicyclobacillus ferrooxydans]|uniref:3-phosphoshikimate 1-carboxyvinyltransferase n=1 Tax=Alicyclobacillus ferrooxydans TaxID=471514 RepID=A0A0P9D8P0_9BACL|nr:hypothetical protein AN477_01000 [Alicyclobacillus ferrooxydans]